jgi:hypothetical protein
MTFYNVISGILFIGAFQAFLHALGTRAIFLPATLVAIMCNEAVLTSELIEDPPEGTPRVVYSLSMKFVDLVTFFVLAFALLIVSPNGNTFNVDVTTSLEAFHRVGVFYVLLAGYWGLTLGWNTLAGRNDPTKWKYHFILVVRFMWVPFLCVGLLFLWKETAFEEVGVMLTGLPFVLVIAYMLAKLKTRA